MFPFIRLFAPFRYYLLGLFFLSLVGYQASLVLNPSTVPVQCKDPRLAEIVAYEDLLRQKADQVLRRFGSDDHTVDLSVTLDHATITTTTFDPGARHETWQEEVIDTPRLRGIKMCVTLEQGRTNIDHDQLYRSLSYALGIDLARGDLLRIVQR